MIILCQCGQENRVPDTPDLRRAYLCGRCGSNLYFPASSNTILGADKHEEGQTRRIPRLSLRDLAILLVVAGGFTYGLWHVAHMPKPYIQPSHARVPKVQIQPVPTNPVEAREQEIVLEDIGRLGDARLDAEYDEIDARYFGNELPFIPVIWEPRLREVGPLIGNHFILKGLAIDHAGKILVLVNPSVRSNPGELRRVLCHEMVHVYLFTIGDMKANHGPAFQAELRKLWQERAFQGIPATADEKKRLRSWLKKESHRLDAESVELRHTNSALNEASEELDRQKSLMQQEGLELNQRISLANKQNSGWPAENEIDAFRTRTSALNQRITNFEASVSAFNANAESYDAELKRFNRMAWRYNLMMAYPDGLDENSVVRAAAYSKLTLHGSVTPLPNLTK